MQGFLLGHFMREHFLKLLGSVMNDIEHNFFNTVSTERILQWRTAVQELISIGFARTFFMKKVQPAVDAIDARIKSLKKVVADLKARHERLLSGATVSSHFEDQTLISGL